MRFLSALSLNVKLWAWRFVGMLGWWHQSLSLGLVNPEATNLTARNLDISSYTFTVKAQTAVGECGTTFFTATLNSLSMLILFPSRPLFLLLCISVFFTKTTAKKSNHRFVILFDFLLFFIWTVCLNSSADNLVKLVFISLVTVFSLLSLIAILCYRHWTW